MAFFLGNHRNVLKIFLQEHRFTWSYSHETLKESKLAESWFGFVFEGRFFWNEKVSHQSWNQVCKEIAKTPVPGMFDLADIFQLIIDGFNDRSFS